MYTFQIKQKDRSKILSVFHILVGLILVLDLLHVRGDKRKDWIFSSVYIISCVFIFLAVLLQKKILQDIPRHMSLLLFESALLLGGAIYFWGKGVSFVAFSHGILAGIIILFWIYLKRIANGETIMVSEQNIVFPGLSGSRIIEWTELTNVIKKFDVLSFDFKSNKLVQVEVVNTDDIKEDEFNEFCRHQLRKAIRNDAE